MPKTQPPVNVNSIAWTTVRALTYCRKITVNETNQAGTTDYKVAAPTTVDGVKTIPAGAKLEVIGPFSPNDVVCNLQAATGSTTFDIIEEGIV